MMMVVCGFGPLLFRFCIYTRGTFGGNKHAQPHLYLNTCTVQGVNAALYNRIKYSFLKNYNFIN